MKTFLRIAMLAVLAALPQGLLGQIIEPVSWKTSVQRADDGSVQLIADATIEGNWHMYSRSSGEDGPHSDHLHLLPQIRA